MSEVFAYCLIQWSHSCVVCRRLDWITKNYGPLLIPVVIAKIPEEMKLVISRKFGENLWDCEIILDVLKKEISAREKISVINNVDKDSFSTNASLFASKGRRQEIRKQQQHCAFCNGKYKSQRCDVMATPEMRFNHAKKNGMCFLCLRKNHLSRDCTENFRCFRCKNKHHVALCMVSGSKIPDDFKPVAEIRNKSSAGLDTANFICESKNVLLQTAVATVCSVNERNCAKLRLLFDSGSQNSYISPQARELLKLETIHTEKLNIKTFGGNENSNCLDAVKFAVKSDKRTENIYVNAFVSTICKPLSGQAINLAVETYDHLKGLKLADSHSSNNETRVDILIGADHYWDFMTNDIRKGKFGPVAIYSKLGFILSGPIGNGYSKFSGIVSTHSLKIATESGLDKKLDKFWDLESVGVLPQERTFLDEFKDSVKFDGSRYEVKLPFKDNVNNLANNYELSLARLKSLCKKFERDPELFTEYTRIINEQENIGIIEPVKVGEEMGGIHYLPHKPVVRHDKITTKTRMVFDASSRAENEFSLNECLATAPSLTPSLFGVLTRFRSYKFAVIGDIEKAFLQISLNPDDREYVRFLWFDDTDNIDFNNFENNKLKEYRICRVLFGGNLFTFYLNRHARESHRESKTSGQSLRYETTRVTSRGRFKFRSKYGKRCY